MSHLALCNASMCKLYGNDSLRAGGMVILEPFRSKPLSDVSSSYIS